MRGAVLVTGAAGGIGRACVHHLAQLGCHVLAGVRDTTAADALWPGAAGRVTPVRLDVTDDSSVHAAMEVVAAAVGARGLAGLVNNAGITIPGPLEFLPRDEFRRQLDVNVAGQLAVMQAALPLLRIDRGRIVNVGSLSGRIALPFYGAYAASKFALEALTDAMRVEVRPWGIQVVLVEPGVVATPIWDRAFAAAEAWSAHLPPAAQAEMQALYGPAMAGVRHNARRLARAAAPPEEVAAAVGRALLARRPRPRYRVGQSVLTRALLLLPYVPVALRDRLIARTLPRYPASGDPGQATS